jgi:hypothetical protein
MILDIRRKDYGGIEVIDSRDPDSPVYFAPHLLAACWSGGTLTAAGLVKLDDVMAQRYTDRVMRKGL